METDSVDVLSNDWCGYVKKSLSVPNFFVIANKKTGGEITPVAVQSDDKPDSVPPKSSAVPAFRHQTIGWQA